MTDHKQDKEGQDGPVWLMAGIFAAELLAVSVVVWHLLTWAIRP